MSFDLERIYALLPAVYRIRDYEEGEPLKSLLGVIAEQVAVLEEDLEQLYDDQFIETCAEWAVPYIGDLVGARGLYVWQGAEFSNRAQVANTLAYRRRKGTASVIEQLARDVTGWPASVVEFFQLLATTQYMNHLRLANVVTPDLRRGDQLERVTTPFDPLARNADVRRIEPRRGRYNIPNIGIFLWRIESYPLTEAPAYRFNAADATDRRFLFNPLGLPARLYNLPDEEDDITHLATPENVPAPITRRQLAGDLARHPSQEPIHYGNDRAILLKIDGVDARPDEVVACDLSDDGGTWAHANMTDRHAIDPVLGRLRLNAATAPDADVRVSFRYGFSAEMGGGEYGRAESFVGTGDVIKVPTEQASISDAFNQLNQDGVVEIIDNNYYVEPLATNVPAGLEIEIRAVDERRAIVAVDNDWLIGGGADSELTINGLALMSGALLVPQAAGNNLRVLRLNHCTLMPGPSPAIRDIPARPSMPRLVIRLPNVRVEIDRCILGAIHADVGAEVFITNSIIDAGDEREVAYAAPDGVGPGAPLEIENSTVIGRLRTSVLEASNTIFFARAAETEGVEGPSPESEEDALPEEVWLAPLSVARLQEGCVRFSYVPPGSQVPRRYECQPLPDATASEAERVRPLFTSLRYGEAGYCQLSRECAVEIRTGADDEAEMGAFHNLFQPQREANLRARLEEYLRFGLEAGIFYAS